MHRSIVLAYVLFLVVAANAASHKRFKRPRILGTSIHLRDKKGCDMVISSCGKNGRCCDKHDKCYKEHGCDYLSWLLVRECI
jgi:hypothetical protein